MKRIVGDDRARFESKFDMEPMSGCWLWLGALDGHGYGHVWMRGQIMKAHRASWILNKGDIPPQQWVLHRCDNPACVNPAHLFLGDRTANMRDMAAKGRQVFQVSPEKVARGERSAKAILTEEKVRAIKARLVAGTSLSVLAREYGVCKATVAHIRSGRNWAHVTP